MILAVDIGTTVLKASLIDNNGKIVNLASCRLHAAKAMTDPAVWIKSFSECSLSLNAAQRDIDCIIISGNGPTLTPSDSGNALLWTHNAKCESDLIFRETGRKLLPSMFLPKALFIKNKMPEIYSSNRFFLSSPEYVSFKLTGTARTAMPLEGLEKWYWDREVLKTLDLDESKFPPFISSGELLGKVTAGAASVFHLTEGTPVLSGCPDFVSAILGSGAMHQGQICNRSGTGEGINYCSSKAVDNPLYMCYRHPNQHDWNISTVIPESGSLIDAAKKPEMSYSDFFKTEQCRKICIDICNQIKESISRIVNGDVTEIRLTGGPSKSDAFNQMRADICNYKIVTLESPEAGLSGLGILAISSLEKQNIVTTADKIVKIKKEYLPTKA